MKQKKQKNLAASRMGIACAPSTLNNSRKVTKKKRGGANGGATNATAASAEQATISQVEVTSKVTSEKDVDLKIFRSYLANVFEKMPKGLREEFTSIRRFNDFEKMRAFVQANEKGLNRYKDVGCLDNCRVVLDHPFPQDYIHANYVSIPSNPKKFICAQAPLEKTVHDFWYMLVMNKVEVIMMLCNLEEKGAKKCFKYYPDSGDSVTYGENELKITIKCKSTKKLNYGSANLRESLLQVDGLNKSLRTRHLHWIDWPDRSVPPADNTVIRLLSRYRATDSPIVVHCSAGIGRTGCVVMIEYYLDLIAGNRNMPVGAEVMQEIRKQRNNSVQTEYQYLFVHMVILNHLHRKGILDRIDKESLPRLFTMFSEEYKKIVI